MSKRTAPEVSAGSMADIAFLLLIFFLVTTTIETNQGISTKLPPKMPDTEVPPIKQKNVFMVVVNQNDQLLVEDELMEVKNLRQAAIDFLDNGGDGSCTYCKGIKDAGSSDNPEKAVISLKNDRGTSYSTYITVQNELIAAYDFLRERERQRLYPNELPYLEMDAEYNAAKTSDDRKEALKPKIQKLQELYPRKLSEAETQSN